MGKMIDSGKVLGYLKSCLKQNSDEQHEAYTIEDMQYFNQLLGEQYALEDMVRYINKELRS